MPVAKYKGKGPIPVELPFTNPTGRETPLMLNITPFNSQTGIPLEGKATTVDSVHTNAPPHGTGGYKTVPKEVKPFRFVPILISPDKVLSPQLIVEK